MGSPKDEKIRQKDDEEQHEVAFGRDFDLGVTEVTQAQYRAVMGSNPSYFCKNGEGKDKVAGMDTDAFPVERVRGPMRRNLAARWGKNSAMGTSIACRQRRNGSILVGEGGLLKRVFRSISRVAQLPPFQVIKSTSTAITLTATVRKATIDVRGLWEFRGVGE